MRENVTVIFKSFERQKMAKRLYENLQKYYPGVRVVIADDSRKPLDLQGDSLTIIQLPFNSGLSYGLNQALERVDTPYQEMYIENLMGSLDSRKVMVYLDMEEMNG